MSEKNLLTAKQVYNRFIELSGCDDNKISDYSTCGPNAIRLKLKNGGNDDLIYIHQIPDLMPTNFGEEDL